MNKIGSQLLPVRDDLFEQHLYGASRLGMIKQAKTVYSNGNEPIVPLVNIHKEGLTFYELANYLGNVEAVITDRKTWDVTDENYQAVLIREADYYPFGMVMPGRNKMDGEYRYGYNGMELSEAISPQVNG